MRFAEYIIVAVLIGGGVAWLTVAAYRAFLRRMRRYHHAHAHWSVYELERRDKTHVYVVKNEDSHLIGSAARMDDDYMDQLLTLRSKAESKRDEWNVLDRRSR